MSEYLFGKWLKVASDIRRVKFLIEVDGPGSSCTSCGGVLRIGLVRSLIELLYSVVLPHLEDRLVLGDGHHFLLVQHEVAKTESNEQSRHERLYVFRIQALWNRLFSSPEYAQKFLMQPVEVLLGSCGVVDLLLTHITTPVLLVSSPVSQHVPLRITRLPSTRHEGEQVVQRIIAVPCTNIARFPTFS